MQEAPIEPIYIPLRVRSEYNLTDSIVRIESLLARARALRLPAIGLADAGKMHAARKFAKTALAAGVQPIIGCDCLVRDASQSVARLLFLCQNAAGYANLIRHVSRAAVESGHAGEGVIDKAWLTPADLEGLILLSGNLGGDIGQALAAGRQQEAEQLAADWAARMPGRYYLEIQRIGLPGQEACNQQTLALAARLGLPVVATQPVQFLERAAYETHEARICISDGTLLHDPSRPRQFSPEQYLKTADEMQALFADLPQALANSVAIARRCAFATPAVATRMPRFPLPADGRPPEEAEKAYLRQLAHDGLVARMRETMPADVARARWPAYRQRLETETKVIQDLGFAGYFLIVSDFIRWAKRNGVMVGPGRGSGAGSLVAWALRITELDPIKYDLLFERFLNPERVSLPDFDVDFAREGRERVIEYVRQRYGAGRVCQIATFGTLAARASVVSVGKILGMPDKACHGLSKMIPARPGVTLEEARRDEPRINEMIDRRQQVAEVFGLAGALEGLARNIGVHAGGVIIAPDRIGRCAPVCLAPGSAGVITQYDKDDIEEVGLIKFDFLGLKTLDILSLALDYVRALEGGAGPDLDNLPLDDAATWRLIQAGDTTEVFQLSSPGMKELARNLKPDTFEDLIALLALYRPGPLGSGMDRQFILRKQGKQPVDYFHPKLEETLKSTYGIILYQEQVMLIAQLLAGYSLGGADMLRRAMGKKKAEEMAKHREIFTKGATERGVDPALARNLFDLMEKFAEYGFNKSHSAAYALVAYQTAYLKAHYPAAFMAAAMSWCMDNSDKLQRLLADARDSGLEVLAPEINASGFRFAPASRQALRFGLGAIKNTGSRAIAAIVEEREANGPYQGFVDFCARIDGRLVNRRVIEALVLAGAFDALEPRRATLAASIDTVLERQGKQVPSGQGDLFGGVPDAEAVLVDTPDWTVREQLDNERKALGFYFSGHPFESYAAELAGLCTARLGDLKPGPEPVVAAGIVVRIKEITTRRSQKPMAFVELSDASGQIEVTVFPDLYAKCRQHLVENALLVVQGKVELDGRAERQEASEPADAAEAEEARFERVRVLADQVYDLAGAQLVFGRAIELSVREDLLAGGVGAAELLAVLAPWRGGHCPVRVHYSNRLAQCDIELGGHWRVGLDAALLQALVSRLGPADVRVSFRRG